jgi:Nucleoside 2-deoxyribosyltransferase.
MQPTVYLAGPITGCSFNGCTDWRNDAIAQLAQSGIRGLSPMRGKEHLSHVKEFTSDGDKYRELYGVNHVMSTNRGIMTRDRFDATRCSALLVNLLGATRVSVGTVMEIAWADAKRTPIVAVMEEEGNPHHHGMVLEAIGFRVATLNEAIHVLKVMLS